MSDNVTKGQIDSMNTVAPVEKPKMGGGLRYNSGKAELHQVPTSNIFAIAKTLQYGAQKYAKGNFRKGMDWTIVYDCAMRHMMKWLDGEEIDEESGLPHLYHAITNIGFLIEYRVTYPEGDDRFRAAPIAMSAETFDKIKFNEYKKPEPKLESTLSVPAIELNAQSLNSAIDDLTDRLKKGSR